MSESQEKLKRVKRLNCERVRNSKMRKLNEMIFGVIIALNTKTAEKHVVYPKACCSSASPVANVVINVVVVFRIMFRSKSC